MSHRENVDHLNGIAQLSGATDVLQLATIAVLAELAAAVDRLEANQPPPPEETERGFGSI